MKSIVIGGAGFIGSLVTQALLASGREVTVVGRRPPQAHTKLPDCLYVSADLGNRGQVRELLEPGCDVIDLAYATVPKTSYGDPIFDLLSNLPPSVSLLEEAQTVGIRRLVVVSSGGTVYGPAVHLPISESHPTAPVSPYGITKLTIDHYALMFHHTRGLPVVVVRPANAYGIQQRAHTGQGFLAAAIHAIRSHRDIEIYGPRGTIRDYIHVSDVAGGIIAALEDGVPGEIYNLGTGVGTSNLQAIDLLQGLVAPEGYTISIRHLPPRRFDVDVNVLDSSKLQAISSWRPRVSLPQGLAEMWEHAADAPAHS